MPLTDSALDVAQVIFDKLVDNKDALALADVWWGDQTKMPHTPTAAVEPGPKTRSLAGAPRQTQVSLDTYVLLYTARITDAQVNRKDSLRLAEAVEALIHEDRTLGGIVIHNMVTSMDPGYATRGGALMSAVRMTVTSTSKVLLPYA